MMSILLVLSNIFFKILRMKEWQKSQTIREGGAESGGTFKEEDGRTAER